MHPLNVATRSICLSLLCFATVSCAQRLAEGPSPQSVLSEAPESAKPTVLAVQVVRISEEYANINTDLAGSVLIDRGVALGTRFSVVFRKRTLEPMLGKNYSDVPKGDWVALIEDDGNVQLAISYGHAATDLGCAVGDTLYVGTPGVSTGRQ